ncbi:hypothetical protein E4U59_001056 [Claviceps monticola]|nr:hypothetical protein E4U59_001056 [Claviceps monticola]
MRSTFVLFGLAAVALANLIRNADEMRNVPDTQGFKVEADTRMTATRTKNAAS